MPYGQIVGVTAAPAVILPNDLANYQASLLTRAGVVDAGLQVCAAHGAIPQATIAAWLPLKQAIGAWAGQVFLRDFVDLGSMWTLGQSLESGLEQWELLGQQQCGMAPPPKRPPPNDPNLPDTGDVTGAIKWVAGAIVAVALVVLLGKVV